MSAQPHEPLRVVPPLDQQHRMALLLHLRRTAERARDAALAAPRKAAAFLGRLFRSSSLRSATGWLRRLTGQALRPLAAMAHRVGGTGVAAGITTALTNPSCRRILGRVGRLAGRGLGWLARVTYTAVDRGLRCFGKVGNKAADLLFAGVVSLGGKIASVAAPVVHRVFRFTDPETAHVRLLAGAARSYFVHRVVKAMFRNTIVRLLVEGVLLPLALDSRAAAWLRQQVRTLRKRASSLKEQAEQMPAPRPQADAKPTKPVVEVPLPLWEAFEDEELPVPANRAERRAQERQAHRKPRTA